MYKFTHQWFLKSALYSELESGNLCRCVPGPVRALEIGSFEGLSSVCIAEKMLNYPGSFLKCVDPFLSIDNDHFQCMSNETEENFRHNISICKNSDKIEFMKMSSVDFFKTNTETFNFIYVDGSHDPDVIVNDMEESFKVLENGGIMWCDDYLGGPDVPDAEKPIKQAMDKWFDKYTGQYEVILNSYQIAIQKINADAT